MSNSRSTLIGWVVTSVIVVGAIAGLIFLAGKPTGTGTSNSLRTVGTDDYILGPSTAPAVVIVYGDFQCPACKSYEPVLKGLKTEFGDQLALVFRHFPLKSAHKYAESAARASEAANLQDKFWQFHDLLYDRQGSWSVTTDIDGAMAGYAKDLGLDVEKFKTDYKGAAVQARIDRDANDARVLSLSGTPSFFLNGSPIAIPNSQQAFADLIRVKLPK